MCILQYIKVNMSHNSFLYLHIYTLIGLGSKRDQSRPTFTAASNIPLCHNPVLSFRMQFFAVQLSLLFFAQSHAWLAHCVFSKPGRKPGNSGLWIGVDKYKEKAVAYCAGGRFDPNKIVDAVDSNCWFPEILPACCWLRHDAPTTATVIFLLNSFRGVEWQQWQEWHWINVPSFQIGMKHMQMYTV